MRRCADFCCDGRNPAEFMLPETELQRLTPDSPQRSIPARLEYRAEGLRLHTQGGWDFCLYRDALEQLRSTVSHSRLLADISRSGHRYAKPNNSRHFVERSQLLPRDSEGIELSTSIRPNLDTVVSTILAAVFGSPMSPSTRARFADAGKGLALVMFCEFATTL